MTTPRLPLEAVPAALSRRTVLGLALASSGSALLAGCGGGGDDATADGTASASSFTAGVIGGFGSVIVGGVRFDDSSASVGDEDDAPLFTGAMRLGMTVEIEGGPIDRAAATARALRIRVVSEVRGPVEAIDVATGTVTVLGQSVVVTGSTLFDDTLAGGLSALSVGAVVEVFGILDPANARVVATRIEAESGVTAYAVRGRIAGLDTTARRFSINGLTVSYAGLPAAMVPPGLANGQWVRVRLQTAPVDGLWPATALRGGRRWPELMSEARLEGIVTAFDSTASFSVNGLPVNAAAASFPDGTSGVVLGARVEVSGRISGGVLQAATVEVEERRLDGPRWWDLRGEITRLDTGAKTFALRGLTIAYGAVAEWRNGAEAGLANGLRVRVRGPLAADRTRIDARLIDLRP